MSTPHDCPILVWMISLNRNYAQEEYDACYALVRECVDPNVPYKPYDPDQFRNLLLAMLPLLMMRHRRIPRAKWRDCVTTNGKHWIEQNDLPPEKFLHSMIGYSLAADRSLLGIAMTQGAHMKVKNIGLGIHMLKVPGSIPLSSYIESQQHKLTAKELAAVMIEDNPNSQLEKLRTILALKDSYAKATGQEVLFDWTRLELDLNKNTVNIDGHTLTGWEFRLFQTKVDGAGGAEEEYQCCCAFFRGCEGSKLVWYDDPKQLESWVQFINIDQMMKVIPKLSA